MSASASPLAHVLPFAAAVAIGAVVTLGLRAGLSDGSASSAAHEMHAEQDQHAGHAMPMPAAPTATAAAPEPAPTGLLVDLGNLECPIMGNEVSGQAFSEWRGLRIGHCCPPCKDKFVADPEARLDAAGIPWRPLVERIDAVKSASGAERTLLLEALSAEYTIIRKPEPTRAESAQSESTR